MKLTENDLIRWWGTPEEYYKEKERFLKEHEKADFRTTTKDGLLVSATYYFKPYQVASEQLDLFRMLAEANAEKLTPPSE